jgi:glycosyltransferase involved in cell wall biosynthesis
MKLTILFDHRFYCAEDGSIKSPKHYDYSFFAKRYLQVFDRVQVLARLTPGIGSGTTINTTHNLGPGLELISLGDWSGPAQFLPKQRGVRAIVRRYLTGDGAALIIAPSVVGFVAGDELKRIGQPYSVEVGVDPYVMFSPGVVNHPLRPLLRWWFTQQLRRQCADAVAASYVTTQTLQQRYPCSNYAVGVSDVELAASALAATPRRWSGTVRPFTLVTVGTMAQTYKGQDVLIDAVSSCVNSGLDLHLVLVGDGKHRPEFEARAAAAGLGGRVQFVGQVPAGSAVRSYLDKADVFVLPSRTEGLPRALIEAMARALPCIGSRVGGIPELLPDEAMVPPGDAAALAAKIRAILSDPAVLARMSIRNLAKAGEYTEEKLRSQRLAFYREILERTTEWQSRNSQSVPA